MPEIICTSAKVKVLNGSKKHPWRIFLLNISALKRYVEAVTESTALGGVGTQGNV